jgi:Flp pilus assembly protein CpaB
VHLLRQVTAGLLVGLALVLALRPVPSAAPPVLDTTRAVVAATDLPAGRVLTAADLEPVERPAATVPDGASAEEPALTGQVLAAPVRRGEVVTDVRVVGPGLWAQVPPGQVAAPVRLADLAVATLLRAGDRVDVLASTDGTDDGGAVVVAADALVLSAPPATAPADPPGSTPEGAGLLVLAVSAETARVLAGAATGATLTVTLGPQ